MWKKKRENTNRPNVGSKKRQIHRNLSVKPPRSRPIFLSKILK